MNSNYLFGIFGALLVVAIGIFLLGRDGTEESVTQTIETPAEEIAVESLPENTDENAPEETESPQIESEEDSALADKNETTDLPEKERDTVIVTYTDLGFSPKSITINQGDTVIWMNNSSRNMWVASNIHPTHNEYPEESADDCSGSSFDACTGVGVGKNWSFVFDEVGEWGYHDHLNSSRTGTIVVE